MRLLCGISRLPLSIEKIPLSQISFILIKFSCAL